jgi:eukaryotic-like serine/threonine-protein kinase
MTPERWEQIRDVLEQALELAPGERSAFLNRACSSDQSLRQEVETLLASSADLDSNFLQSSELGDGLGADSGIGSAGALEAGQLFAQRFQVLRRLGEGGMGQVWLAEQIAPVRRQVALKLIKAGMYDEAVVQRFQSERQSLAIMDHPAIAKIFDAGATAQGQPYFVMEYVPGLPITEYCDQKKLKIRDRLELFIQACDGVQHAHQKAIIHRDLKPPNILVVEVDGKPVPRIIDFGLAKATMPQTADESLFTRPGHFVGTPGYMSPEQADPSMKDVDTRTDIYSLGVVLYVLLTGVQPFETKQRPKQPLDEWLRKLREEEPPRPSTKVNTDRDKSTSTAEARGTDPKQLASGLRGDLDCITMKAIEKDRSRRYGTPSELAADVRRYLNQEPVVARPASAAYRSGKFIKRHKLSLAVAAVVAMVMVGGAVAIVREARVARMQQGRAERRFNDVRALANSLLFDIHDSIRDLPGSTAARKLLVDRALKYLDSLSQEASDVPDLQRELAAAYERVGDVQGNPYFANLGDTAGSIASYRKALRIRLVLADDRRGSSDDQAALVAIYIKLGFGLEATSDFSAALETLQRAYPIAEKLAAEQKNEPQSQEAFAGVCFAMALCLSDMGDITGSLEYYRKSAAIRETITGGSPAFQASVQTMLAGVYGFMSGIEHLRGNIDSALSLQSKGRDIIARQIKSDPRNATLQQYLLEGEYWVGYYLAEKGLPAQALPHFEAALAGYQKLTSADAHNVLTMRYLGQCYMSIGRALAADGKEAEGIRSAGKAVHLLETLAAADHADTNFKSTEVAYARSALAETYSRLAVKPGVPETSKIASWREARSWYQKSLDTWLLLKKKAPLGRFDAAQPDKIKIEIAKCDAALAKLNANNP